MNYQSYMLHNFKSIPQVKNLPTDLIEAIEIVGSVLPFKTNNYVVENLINWERVPNDPIFKLTFPQREMLLSHHYEQMKKVIKNGASKSEIKTAANEIRLELNPHYSFQAKVKLVMHTALSASAGRSLLEWMILSLHLNKQSILWIMLRNILK